MASAALVRHGNVVVKISGAGTLAKEPFPYKDIWDLLRRIFDAFGLDRCIWSTDWTKFVLSAGWLLGEARLRTGFKTLDGRRAPRSGRSRRTLRAGADAAQALRPPDIGKAHPPIARAVIRERQWADVSRETTIVIDKHCGASLRLGQLPLYASFI